jgi:hypothetical protein
LWAAISYVKPYMTIKKTFVRNKAVNVFFVLRGSIFLEVALGISID